jgi:hypothetical protein
MNGICSLTKKIRRRNHIKGKLAYASNRRQPPIIRRFQ